MVKYTELTLINLDVCLKVTDKSNRYAYLENDFKVTSTKRN